MAPEQAVVRVAPAHERLEAGDPAELGVGGRLVEELELVALERVAQLLAEREAVAGVEVARGVVERDAAARALGEVHGDVGAAHQLAVLGGVLGVQRDADADADVEREAVDGEGAGDRLDHGGPGAQRPCAVGAGWEQDGELVAAQAREEGVMFL
jgi:hypothetical protein